MEVVEGGQEVAEGMVPPGDQGDVDGLLGGCCCGIGSGVTSRRGYGGGAGGKGEAGSAQGGGALEAAAS